MNFLNQKNCGSKAHPLVKLLVLAVILASALPSNSPGAIVPGSLPEFLISTGWPPTNQPPQAIAKALVVAKFNTVIWPLDKLEDCRSSGIKLMAEGAHADGVTTLARDPTLWGYHLADEPKATAFPDLARQVKSFRSADPEHPANINMLCFAGEMLYDYMKQVKPDILSYDHYQWWWGSHSHFEKLEQHRAAALAANIPLTCWVEVNANPNVEWRSETICDPQNAAKIRQSVYTSLAYGVKGIQWFSADMLFKPGSTDLNECGRQVAKINSELAMLGPTLIQLRSIDVFHTTPLPRRTSESQHDHWAQVTGQEMMWGMFKDPSETDYIFVVNRDIHQRQQALVQFQTAGYGRKVTKVLQLDKQTGKWIPFGNNVRILFVVDLDPGDGQLFKILKQEDAHPK